ncbi:hypothetical protein M8C21_033617 [Ambrosia artemisiifolia]|uniref:Cathepsin propeptide inhibitor domain-containing protein n=1 Tax=Ambrosia artemisiifolia TaxID=4212 RepID=A0AAD5C0G5_AMBAR|nr:hypothetical protein M8C21_033617 [Ambrosia artemisiifolia]
MALLLKKAVPLRRLLQSRDFSSRRRALTEVEVRPLFEEWAKEHGIVYKSAKEKEFRFWIFKDKMTLIDYYNSICKPSMKIQPNQFSDWTPDELRIICKDPPLRVAAADELCLFFFFCL